MQFYSIFKRLNTFVRQNVKINNCKFSIDAVQHININKCYNKSSEIMKVLNVAEKNDAAKNIAAHLARGNNRRREGLSKFNKIYEFNYRLWNQDCQMVMTSVSGHLMTYEFTGAYRSWQSCHPLSLFDAPVIKSCSEDNYVKIKKTIEREVRSCGALIIWTDCDREGENIGFEIIQVCQAVKPDIRVYRAIFSEITGASVTRAVQNLAEPKKLLSDAVNVRSELDLRIGAAFTRFQTLRLQKVFPHSLAQMLISYGSCQFPTLGFVVERFLAIENFKPEPYWKIKVLDDHDGICTEFRWARYRLFEELPCQIYLDICLENPDATVENVTSKPKSKFRPLPLDTIELEKQGSKKLKLTAKETMKIAERLYTQGFISYPRTETNIFPKELNLRSLVEQQVNNHQWGEFAQRVLEEGVTPRQGKKSDQAHPPIHPTKYADNLQGNEARVYEFIVRHYLACVSKNAEGYETTVDIDIAGEKFSASGLQIIAKNYLDVYVYEKWNSKEIHLYEPRQVFRPTSIEMVGEQTSPPNLLTEADLISLMDKHGIGTDATHAEHIETIKSRQYVGMRDKEHIMPGKLGIGLVMGYDNMGFQMSKPYLRAELENDLKLICDGVKDPQQVLEIQISKYRQVFKAALERANLLDTALAEYIDEQPLAVADLEMNIPPEDPVIFKCPKCTLNMALRDRKQGGGKYIGCVGFPACNNSIWFPSTVTDVQLSDNNCDICPGNMKKLKFKFRPGAFPIYGSSYETCVGGCDITFNEAIGINLSSVQRVARPPDSGYSSSNNNSTFTQSNRNNTQSSNQRSSGNNNRGNTSAGRGASSSSNSSIGLVGFQSNNRPSTFNNRGRGGSSNYSDRNNQNNTKRNNDNWPDDFPDTKRPKTVTKQSGNFNRENINATNADDIESYSCNCHEPAVKLTVKKEGPNKGRQFYKCAKPQGSSCEFFLWATDGPVNESGSAPPPSRNRNDDNQMRPQNNHSKNTWNQDNRNNHSNAGTLNSSRGSADDTDGVMCVCGQPARKFTVRKDGPNKGREFYTCPQGPSSTCSFFEWANDSSGRSNSDNDWGNSSTSTRGRGGGTRERGRGAGNKSRAGGKRKCGICGVEGHTRKTCPENAMD
ncbi:DNA topoisomerase 3-alpha [Microplitis mediator]|uniref:DNA topoisomerase 3-alpha n=1 Tax=Microplitis mediator TaxID=375433 RepID=UPI002552690E|nr:DNA topoisomerase 3-alpha [Microplitis mediator]